jgi:hypothetical protein
MSAPIALLIVPVAAAPVAGVSPGGTAPVTLQLPLGAGVPAELSFETALGTAIATGQLAGLLALTPPPPIPAGLTMVLDGEWRPEEEIGPEPESTEAIDHPVADPAPIEAEVVPLERGLADWFARITARVVEPERFGEAEPEEVELPAGTFEPPTKSPVGPAVESAEVAVSSVSLAVPTAVPGSREPSATAVVCPPSDPAPRPNSPPPTRTGEVEAPVRVTVPHQADPPPGWGRVPELPDPEGMVDAESLVTRRRSFVEIAGFAFPAESDLLDPTIELAAPGLRRGAEPLGSRDHREPSEAAPRSSLGTADLWAHRVVSLPERGPGAGSWGSGSEPRADRPELDWVPRRRDPRDGTSPVSIEQHQLSGPENRSPPVDVRAATLGARPTGRDEPAAVGSDSPAVAMPRAPDPRISRRVDHLLLELADDQRDYGQLRVSVAGPSVRATILPNDPVLAERLNVEIRQLRQTLADRGFSEPQVTVQSPKPPEPAGQPQARDVVVDLSGAAGRAQDAGRSPDRQSSDDRRDRGADGRPGRHEPPPNQDGGRSSHRSRDQRHEQRGSQS